MSSRRFISSNQPQTFAAAFPPWFPFFTTDGSGNLQGNFFPGTIGGVLPGNISTPLTLNQAVTNYIWAACTASNGAVTAVTLTVGTSWPTLASPTSGSPPTSFNIPIAIVTPSTTIFDNVVGFGNIWAQPYVALLDTINTGALTTAPFTPWYNWQWGGGD
jgi:hypothetical protein